MTLDRLTSDASELEHSSTVTAGEALRGGGANRALDMLIPIFGGAALAEAVPPPKSPASTSAAGSCLTVLTPKLSAELASAAGNCLTVLTPKLSACAAPDALSVLAAGAAPGIGGTLDGSISGAVWMVNSAGPRLCVDGRTALEGCCGGLELGPMACTLFVLTRITLPSPNRML